jgi:hypothetical protein
MRVLRVPAVLVTTPSVALLMWMVTTVAPTNASPNVPSVVLGQGAEDRGLSTVNRICAECHPTDRVLSSRRTRTQWGEVIEEMISQGAKISDNDYTVIHTYLVAKYGRVYVNLAPADEMVEVLRLSEADAQKILAFRKEHGKFADFEALMKVPGVSAEALTAAKDALAF